MSFEKHDPRAKRQVAPAGPDTGPAAPYPVYLEGRVGHGFKRGSKDLGCPTANLPDGPVMAAADRGEITLGVAYGLAQIARPGPENTDTEVAGWAPEHYGVFPMVMSIGYNPFYHNKTVTGEVHVLHEYPCDFYGQHLRVVVLGYIRPELDYAGVDALIEDINIDKRIGLVSLERPAYAKFARDPFFSRT